MYELTIKFDSRDKLLEYLNVVDATPLAEPEPSEPTREDLKTVALAAVKAGRQPEIKQLCQEYAIDRITACSDDKVAELHAKVLSLA